jgi:hypothetical protein
MAFQRGPARAQRSEPRSTHTILSAVFGFLFSTIAYPIDDQYLPSSNLQYSAAAALTTERKEKQAT